MQQPPAYFGSTPIEEVVNVICEIVTPKKQARDPAPSHTTDPPRAAKTRKKNSETGSSQRKSKRDRAVEERQAFLVGCATEEEVELWAGLIQIDIRKSDVKLKLRFEEPAVAEPEPREPFITEIEALQDDYEELRSKPASEFPDANQEEHSRMKSQGEEKNAGHVSHNTQDGDDYGRYFRLDFSHKATVKACIWCESEDHDMTNNPHHQCYTCGKVDGDHRTWSCPVNLCCYACGSRGHTKKNCTTPLDKQILYEANCAKCGSPSHSSMVRRFSSLLFVFSAAPHVFAETLQNCPSLWRIYDCLGAESYENPEIVFACGNCGSTGEHFLDDCPCPRPNFCRGADHSSAFSQHALLPSFDLKSHDCSPFLSEPSEGYPWRSTSPLSQTGELETQTQFPTTGRATSPTTVWEASFNPQLDPRISPAPSFDSFTEES